MSSTFERRERVLDSYDGSTYNRYVFDETPVALTASYKNVLFIDARKIRQSVIVFRNDGVTNDLNYKIYAMGKYDPVTLNKGTSSVLATFESINPVDDQWVNLISIIDGQTGTTYDHNTAKVLNADKRFYESFVNQWFCVLVQAKSDSGTDLKIWHRGQS